MIPEGALSAAGFLRERCVEGLQHTCPGCGTEMLGVPSSQWSNGVVCPTCSEVVLKPLISCARCKQALPGDLAAGERGCLSIKAYREKGAVPAFGPSEPIWAFRQTERSEVLVVGDTELRARIARGKLDGTWLVLGPNDEAYRAIAEVAGLRELIVPLHAPASLAGTGAPPAAVGSGLGPRGARTGLPGSALSPRAGLSGSAPSGGPSRPPAVATPRGALGPRPIPSPPRPRSTPPSIPPVLPTPATESSGASGASWPKSTLLTWGSGLLAYVGAVGPLVSVAKMAFGVNEAQETPGDIISTMLIGGFAVFFGLRGIARRSKSPRTVGAVVLAVSVLTAVYAFEESQENKNRPALGEAWVVESVGVKLVPIAAGSFAMGSTNGRDNEKPVTQLTLTKPYWLGATEVTQGQWEAIMGNNPSNFKGGNLPVEGVSYEDAMEFCRKLTERERAADRLPEGYAYTLPTEAQWEYACRAGTTGDYAGNPDAMGWYDGISGKKTHEVGGKQANAWGLYDMHGNVWEWCLDWYAEKLPGGSVSDSKGPASGSDRVFRGGGWGNDAAYCRSAFRLRFSPGNRNGNLGFRLALSSVP